MEADAVAIAAARVLATSRGPTVPEGVEACMEGAAMMKNEWVGR